MARDYGVSPFEFSGVPLGGIGTGSVEIRADGHFHDWQIMNNRPWGNGPSTAEMEDEGLFFGIVAHDGEKPRELMLNRPRWFDRDAYGSSEIFKWTLDPYHMPWMEFPTRIGYEAQVPFANLEYETKDYPIKARMEAWSPFIPLDAKNSGQPVFYCTFTLTNATARRQRVSLFGAIKNCVAYDHPDRQSVIKYVESGRSSRLDFSRKDVPADAQTMGSMSLGLWSKKAGKTTYVLHAGHPRDIYDPLMETGHLENLDRSAFVGGVGNNLGGGSRLAKLMLGCSRGVLARTMQLAPRETVEVTFALAWHFPNMMQKSCREGCMEIIGHQYENWFASAADALAYAQKNQADLYGRTREYVDAFYATTADKWLLDAIAAQLTTFAKGTWWDRSGRFAVWEGLGCCGLQTLDITLYGSFPIILFFPELEKKQMELIGATHSTTGRPPHSFHFTFSEACFYPNNRIDNDVQFALLVWRDALWTGDVEFARRMWPAVEAFLKDVEATDKDGDGLPNNAGVDQSYDQFPLYGTSAYVGMQYVAALGAAADLAAMVGQPERANALRARARTSMDTLESQLWNGEYYNLSLDAAKGEGNAGCMADQLSGDWFWRQTTGEGLVELSRARRALKAVSRYCRREGFLANCDWPRGGEVKIRRLTSDQARCPWTGVEYAVAAEMVLLGLVREGLAVTRDVLDRYDKIGMRYNHIECGDHYYRAMSSWAVYLALQGFAMDATAQAVSFSVPKGKAQYAWNTPQAWGRVSFAGAAGTVADIDVVRGALAIRELRLRDIGKGRVEVRVGGKTVGAEVATSGTETAISLDRAITLKRGQRLSVRMAGGGRKRQA